MQRARLVLAVLPIFLLPLPARSDQFHLFPQVNLQQQMTLQKPADNYWRPVAPQVQQQPTSVFGALAELGRLSDEDRLLRARGYIHSFQFRYKSFSYDKDFFNVYKGFTLRKFWDGAFDLGLYKHQLNNGNLFGPSGAPPPARNRLELMLRWNLAK